MSKISTLNKMPTPQDDPTYAAMFARHTDLQLQLLDAEEQLAAMIAVFNAEPADRRTPNQIAAEALVEGKEYSEARDLAKQRNMVMYSEVSRRRSILKDAVDLSARRLDAELCAASRRLLGPVRAEYSKRIAAIATALTALADAVAQERALYQGLSESGFYTSTLAPQPFTGVGNIREPSDRLGRWFREAIAAGHIAVDDVPRAWRDAWLLDFWHKQARSA